MTSNDILAGLAPSFRSKLNDVIAACGEAGFRVVPYQGYRSPAEQARLWRQSRSRSQIEGRMSLLRAAGAAAIANLVEGVGPQFGPHVTNALPGETWHQFGRARGAARPTVRAPSSLLAGPRSNRERPRAAE